VQKISWKSGHLLVYFVLSKSSSFKQNLKIINKKIFFFPKNSQITHLLSLSDKNPIFYFLFAVIETHILIQAEWVYDKYCKFKSKPTHNVKKLKILI